MIHLRKMRPSEFPDYLDYFIPDYAAEISTSYDTDLATATKRAKQAIKSDLPLGVETAGQELLCIIRNDDTGSAPVGYLWCTSIPANKHLFISDFYVQPAYRGRGFAKQALKALEACVATLGCTEIRLRVATENKIAQSVYLASGFRVTGVNMSKLIPKE